MAAKRLNCVIYKDKEYNIVSKLHNSKSSTNMNMKYIWQLKTNYNWRRKN